MDNEIKSRGLVDGGSSALHREISRPFDTYSRWNGPVQRSSEEENSTSPYKKSRSRTRKLPSSYSSESKKNPSAGDWLSSLGSTEKEFQERRGNRRGRNNRAYEQERGRKRTVTWEHERIPSLERDTRVNRKEGYRYFDRIDSEIEMGPEYIRPRPIILPPDENVSSQTRWSSHVQNGILTFNNEQRIEEVRVASRKRTPSLPHSSSFDGPQNPEIIRGIRTQGDDDAGTSQIKGKRSFVTREKGYRGDDWALVRQPQFLQEQNGGHNSSDDDEAFQPNESGRGHEKESIEAGLGDKETIMQTLKRYTTFQGDDLSTIAVANHGNDLTKANASSKNLPLPQPLASDPALHDVASDPLLLASDPALYDVASSPSPLALDPALYDVASDPSPSALDPALHDGASYPAPEALDPALYNIAGYPSSRGAIPPAHADTPSPGGPAGDDSDIDQPLESLNTKALPASAWDGTRYLTYGAEASSTEKIDWGNSQLY